MTDLDDLRKNASPDFIAANPELFPEAQQVSKPVKNMPKIMPVSGQSEAEFQKQLIKELKNAGWMVHAERPARTKDGWVTPVQGNAGFPDIVAVRPPDVLLSSARARTVIYRLTRRNG